MAYGHNRLAVVHGAMVMMLAMPAMRATGDVLVLHNGHILVGEVVDASAHFVQFRAQFNGIWSTVRYSRSQYEYYELEEGDQSDLGMQPDNKPEPAEPEPRQPTGPIVAVIPLHGQVGGLVDGRHVRGTFDADVLATCLVEAEAAGADLVLLDIHSPGGLIDEMELICQTIIDWHRRLRIVAFPRDAFSAAAIISLSCREIIVHPSARVGAAVIVERGPGGMSAVEAKLASVHHARQRQFMQASGHPYEIVQAMSIQETVLWWSEHGGFRTDEPPRDERDLWTQVDGATTVLTMTADELVTWGIAADTARTAYAAGRTLGLTGATLLELDTAVDRYNANFERRLDDLFDDFEHYFEALGGIVAGMNAYVEAGKEGDRRRGEAIKSEIGRDRGKALSVARRIRQADRALLSRRITVGDAIIERLEEDARLIGRISVLLRSDTVDGYNEAADRINLVLAQWREIIRG